MSAARPKYVDCIVRRWELYTGKPATLGGDGRTFEVIAAERQNDFVARLEGQLGRPLALRQGQRTPWLLGAVPS